MAGSGLNPFRRAGTVEPGERRVRVPTAGALRRERRALERAREERIRDVGGLAVEMVRRDRFRPQLLLDRCRDVVAMEERLEEIASRLAAAATARRIRGAPRCACGAPLEYGSHFCANCGRPIGAPVVACSRCEAPLPADARFCARCGTLAGTTARPEVVAATYEQSGAEARSEDDGRRT